MLQSNLTFAEENARSGPGSLDLFHFIMQIAVFQVEPRILQLIGLQHCCSGVGLALCFRRESRVALTILVVVSDVVVDEVLLYMMLGLYTEKALRAVCCECSFSGKQNGAGG